MTLVNKDYVFAFRVFILYSYVLYSLIFSIPKQLSTRYNNNLQIIFAPSRFLIVKHFFTNLLSTIQYTRSNKLCFFFLQNNATIHCQMQKEGTSVQ